MYNKLFLILFIISILCILLFSNIYELFYSTNKIVIFYHICELGNWKDVVKEQLDLIKYTGLYDKTESINIGFLGDKKNILPYLNDKIKLVYTSENKKEHEIPTINKINEFSKNTNDEYYILYIHSKGVTNLGGNEKDYNGQHYWRKFMNYWNITKHQICIDQLNKGYYTVGINCFENHYSGNFWWANSKYIKNLNYLKHKDDAGLQAEFWLLSKKEQKKSICLTKKNYNSLRRNLSGLYSIKIQPKDYGKLNIRIL